jgi:hypothetical protein
VVIHLPQPKQVRELFAELLGREVTLTPAAPFAPGPDTAASVAVYVDDQLRISALIVCDLALSAHAGAAIGLVPVGGATAAIEDGKLSDVLGENLYEVLNIAASMFNVAGADHLRLHALHPAGPPLDPQLRISTLTLGRREDLSVDIAGYGSGALSIVLV